MYSFIKNAFSYILTLIFVFLNLCSFGQNNKDFPPPPNPPRLVNDFAGIMTPAQQENMENRLVDFSKTTSTQITIVTVKNLNGYDVAQYATELGNYWKVGKKRKDNGVVILVSKEDRKINISPGYGLEPVLTDALCGRIIRNEMAPSFKEGNYYAGLQKAVDAIIAVTKGEYTADKKPVTEGSPLGAIIFIIVIVLLIMALSKGGKGGGGGGNYVSGRGSSFLTGAILGGLLGGRGGFGVGGGFGGGGGGGFGGFGGGGFGGGGASGGW